MGRAMLLLAGLIALSCVPGGLAGYFQTPNCATPDRKAPRIDRVSEFKNNNYGGSGVEVLAYSNYKGAAIVAVVESNSKSSGVRLLDVTKIDFPTEITFLQSPVGYPNSVSFYNNVLAVSCDGGPNLNNIGTKTDAGYVLLYTLDISVDRAAGTQTVKVVDQATQMIQLKTDFGSCAMPDMLTWNERGDKIYTACEGEPSSQDTKFDGAEKDPADKWTFTGSPPVTPPGKPTVINPAGAIGVVSVIWAPGQNSIQTAGATKIISIQAYLDKLTPGQYTNLLNAGLLIDVRIFAGIKAVHPTDTPEALITKTKNIAAIDIEPEYIALSDDGRTLYCTLQENNAILVVDLASEEVAAIWPLGLKFWTVSKIDVSDQEGAGKNPLIDMQTHVNLRSLYQPDTIVYKKIRGQGYLFIANEGDAKEEKARVSQLRATKVGMPTLDAKIERLNVNPSCGLNDPFDLSSGYKYVCTYGARSFSIINADTGELVYESKDEFETKIKDTFTNQVQVPSCFNCDRDANTLDTRSDDSGPEPEAMEVMELNGRFFALIGLERQSGFMIYDVTNPKQAQFVQWWVYRDYTKDWSFKLGDAYRMGDMAPEMIKFVPGHKSHTNKPLLLVTNEYSASVTLHTVVPCGEPLDTTVPVAQGPAAAKDSPGVP